MRARTLFSCTNCVLLFAGAVLGAGHHQHIGRWRDPFHRVSKTGPITMSPGDNIPGHHNGLVRREETCAEGRFLCAESVGGGCCPTNYDCATDSCYAATLDPATASACGLQGFYACPYDTEGGTGGCCPVGSICGVECELPEGASTSCPPNYTLCPEAMNYGCCQSGFACGSQICYPTMPTVGTYTSTITTQNSAGATTVSLSVVTTTWTPSATYSDSIPTDLENSDQGIPKFFPTSQPKTDPIGDDEGGGIPKSTIGGIVGGAVALVVIIVLATIFIHFRLKHNEKVIQSEKRSSTKRSRTDYLGTGKTTEDESATQTNGGHTPRPGRHRGESTSSVGLPVAGTTPDTATFGHPSSGSWTGGGGGYYTALPTSNSEGNVRHPSMDSSAGGASYFDHRVSAQTAPNGYRQSVDSAAPDHPYTHARQWSDSSAGRGGDPYVIPPPQELDGRQFVPELQGGNDVVGNLQVPPSSPGLGASSSVNPGVVTDASRRRSSSFGTRPPPSHQTRRRSDSTALHQRGRSDSSSTSGGQALGVVNEAVEAAMTGYYGPANRQVGQTAALLHAPDRDEEGTGGSGATPNGGSSRNSFSVER